MPKQAETNISTIPKLDPVEVAVNELIANNNHILIAKNDILKQQILEFNQSILNIHENEISIFDYITPFRNRLFPHVNMTNMRYFLELDLNPVFINADDLGPQRFKILALERNKKSITTKQFESLMIQYDFKENEDYFKRGDVPPLYSKKPRTVYIISPDVPE